MLPGVIVLIPCLVLNPPYNFINKALEQHVVLEGMYKKMVSLFKQTAVYYAFDPNKYTMEDLFGDLKTFIQQFCVSISHIICVMYT